MVLPSHALVLLVHGGLRPGGVGWWALVVGLVVVVVVVVWALVAVALVVMVMVLRVFLEDPLACRWGLKVGHRLQPLGPYGSFLIVHPRVTPRVLGGRTAWWVVGGGWGPGLTATAVEGSHVPGSGWLAAVVVCWGLGC